MNTIKTQKKTAFNIQLFGTGWYHTPSVSARGYIYDPSGTLYKGEDLCAYFTVRNIEELQERLEQANGLFAVICHSATLNAAAVDSSRIYPLYYRVDREHGYLISDDAYKILRHTDTLDTISKMEYQSAGFPLYGKTLVSDIKQVRPGHYLTEEGEQHQYYTYLTRSHELTIANSQQMGEMLQNVFRRMVHSIGDRQVVIPLSGGNDSRLILCMLKKMGYRKVICYTVGRENNTEEKIAKKVTKELNYPLYIINPTKTEIKELVQLDSHEFQQYYQFIGGLSNFVWLFEYAAINYLRKIKAIEQDAIFIPGHSADYNAGSHLTKACIGQKSSTEYMVRAIMHEHFEYEFQPKLKNNIRNYFNIKKQDQIENWSIYQAFIFENRLPYNINNSARVYEFFGYEVRLPYWDKEFLEFFRKIHIKQLEMQNFYTHTIRQHIFIPMKVDFEQKQENRVFFYKRKIRNRIKHLLPITILRLRKNTNDILGERELAKPMLEELIQHGIYRNKRYAISANQIMKDWYLMKVRQVLHAN